MPPGDIRLFADRRRILQILINLISNASKYSPQGSLIVLRARLRREGGLELMVIDQGSGMSDAEIEVALTLFGQASAGRSQNSGTGLGELRAGIAAETGAGRLRVITPAGHDTASAVVGVPEIMPIPPERLLIFNPAGRAPADGEARRLHERVRGRAHGRAGDTPHREESEVDRALAREEIDRAAGG